MNKDTPTPKNLFIIELSEFNVDLLTQAAQLYTLPHLSKVLQFKKSTYKTNDRYNGGHLTPKTQWTAIHAGVSTRKMEPPLKFCWEILKEHEITVSLSGVFNTDPLEPVLTEIPSFKGRYKQNLSLLKKAFKLGCTFQILKEIFAFKLKADKQSALLPRYLSWLDYMSTLLFCKTKQKQKPQCSILFLGSLSYCQYYHWEGDEKTLCAELVYNLQTLDKILGYIFQQFPEECIIVHNALSQLKVPKTSGVTGRFIPLGTIYSQEVNFPNHIFNYEFNRYLYHHFVPEHYSLKSEYIEDEVFSE